MQSLPKSFTWCAAAPVAIYIPVHDQVVLMVTSQASAAGKQQYHRMAMHLSFTVTRWPCSVVCTHTASQSLPEHVQIYMILERLLRLYMLSLKELCAAIDSNATFARATISGPSIAFPLGFQQGMTSFLLDCIYGNTLPKLIRARQAIGPLGIAALDLGVVQQCALQEYRLLSKVPLAQVPPVLIHKALLLASWLTSGCRGHHRCKLRARQTPLAALQCNMPQDKDVLQSAQVCKQGTTALCCMAGMIGCGGGMVKSDRKLRSQLVD